VAIVIHNYRWRLGPAKGDPKHDSLENHFSGRYSHRILKGIGHNVPQEDPQAFTQAVIAVDRY
jgi:pimeloyl-ACP methyl ester carboxylesterase